MRIFTEEQRFRQIWLLALIGISILIPNIVIFREYYRENNQMSSLEFTGIFLAINLIAVLVLIFKLKTRIDEKGVHYQFIPFHFSSRLITWEEIASIEVRKYDPIGEYGGWGLRKSAPWNRKKRGTAINVSGDIGIQLLLKNGKKLLIGTQKENEALQVLANYKNKLPTNEQ